MQDMQTIGTQSVRGAYFGMRLLLPALIIEACWLCLWLVHPLFTRPWWFQALFVCAYAGYIWAVVQSSSLQGLGRSSQIVVVLGGALLFHLTLIPAPYAFSDDFFRYVWNGRVSAADIDPYRYAPGDPALTPLRDSVIWPNVNAKEQHSPYPPLLESWFALLYRLMPESLLIMKLGMSVLNMGVIGMLLCLLWLRQQPLLWALIYAWNPQVVFQVAFSSHNEPLMLFWLLGALLLGTLSHPMGKLAGGWAFALAIMSKLVPVFVLPVLLQRWGWRSAAVCVLTVGSVYGALLVRGQRILTGAATEASAARFNDGLYYLIERVLRFITPDGSRFLTSLAVLAIMLAVIALLMTRQNMDMVASVGIILATYVLLAASVAPWYVLWVLPFVALAALPRPSCVEQCIPPIRLLGSYWLVFAYTATWSELFYFVETPIWKIIHVLEYLLPLGAMSGVWLWACRRRT